MMPTHPAPTRNLAAGLLALAFGLQLAHAEPARTPRQLIETLGVEVRNILEDTKSDKTPEDAERAVAAQITELIRSGEGQLSLTATDASGNTPLSLAAAGPYPLVVQALLADPSVRLRINEPNRAGETPWMVARFAPSLTLVSCQPGMLTLSRAPLLPPYLRRMQYLLKTQAAAVQDAVQALEDAGADIQPDAAKRAWLARCPNAAPDLRQALVDGELAATLIKDAITRQSEFNKTISDNYRRVPAKPPEGMRFIPEKKDREARKLDQLLQMSGLQCVFMAKPGVPRINSWTGTLLFRATVFTRAGIVELAEIDVQTHKGDAVVADIMRGSILRALAQYKCVGDAYFSQEFQFKVS